jgi:hypothetical protein
VKTQEEEVQELFTDSQRVIFTQVLEVITGPFLDPLAKSTVTKLFHYALLAAYQAGRFAGVMEVRAVSQRVFNEWEAKRREPTK